MRYVKKTVATVLFLLVGLVSLFTPSQALGFFDRFKEKPVIVLFREKLQAFQAQTPEERVYLVCDKPSYRPGETVWFQVSVRNAADMKPSLNSQIVHVEWMAPSGHVARHLRLIARNGTASGDITLDRSLAAGVYRLKVWTAWQKNRPEPFFFVRDIPVQQVPVPGLKMKLDFMGKAFGPGDEVFARLDMVNSENKPVADQDFRITVLLGGTVHKEMPGKTRGGEGALIRFTLPEILDSADGLVTVTTTYQGQRESIAHPIPLGPATLDAGIFPEGGDLVAGLTSRVAVRVRDVSGRPADVQARVETDDGKAVTEFHTVHDGMGLFSITPQPGQKYHLKMVKPRGITRVFPLPACLDRGHTLDAKVSEGKRLDLLIRSTAKEDLTVTVRSRSGSFDERRFSAKQGENRLSFNLESFPMGVIQIALFDSKNIQRAERLCFAQSAKRMTISIQTDRKTYGPREKVSMTVKTLDDRGMPVPARLTVSVVDDSLLTSDDGRQGRILSALLLEPDITGTVHNPSFYFDEKEKNRDNALDLLLMTHAWRGFAWKTMLDEEPAVMATAPERAEIRGVVLAGPGREPVPGATVTVERTKKRVTADEQGRFVIRNLDLYEPESLIASKGIHGGYAQPIEGYSTPVTLFLVPQVFDRDDVRDDTPPVEGLGPDDPGFRPRVVLEGNGRAGAGDHAGPVEHGGKTVLYTRGRVFPETVYATTETSRRNDFRETVFFKGLVETDRRGTARLSFYTSDAVASFRTCAEGIADNGLVGRGEQVFTTRPPFSLDVKVPVSVTMGDEVSFPLTLTNKSGRILTGDLDVGVPQGFKALGPLTFNLSLEDGDSRSFHFPYIVAHSPGRSRFTASFTDGMDTDVLEKDLTVVPRGFPVAVGLSGQDKNRTFDVTIEQPVPGSLKARFTAFPSVLSDLVKGAETVVEEPRAGFEQVLASILSGILVFEHLKVGTDPDPVLMKMAYERVGKGYSQLLAYESPDGGYEWFGDGPGNEMLTALALMAFRDMERVWDGVSGAMVKRTAGWLLSKRDGKGGFGLNDKALDRFGRADSAIINASIVYALSEAGYGSAIRAELDKAVDQAVKSADPYQMALAANALCIVDDSRKTQMLKTLLAYRKKDGSFTGKTTSVTRSTGRALFVETTALAVLAMLKSQTPDMKLCEPSIRFILASRTATGDFGSTQSTVLAMKALSGYDRLFPRTPEDGRIGIFVNGRSVSATFYTKGQTADAVIPETELSGHFDQGPSRVRVLFDGVERPLPYTFSLAYNGYGPPPSRACPLRIQTALKSQDVKAGNPNRMTVTLTNTDGKKGQPLCVAVIGIPGGLSLLPWQLKELCDKKIVEDLKVLDGRLVLYFRQMKPGETKTIALDLKGEVPGIYEAPASCAYLYYNDENRCWIRGERVRVAED